MNQMIPTDQEYQMMLKLAQSASKSVLSKFKTQEDALMAMLTAKELGLPLMFGLNEINVIKSRPELSARAISALIRKHGHKIEQISCDSLECKLKGTRRDTGESMIVSYTIEDAKNAGLVREGSNYKKFPSDMMFARAVSRLGRRLFSDILGSCYVQGEILVEGETIDSDNDTDEENFLSEDQVLEYVGDNKIKIDKLLDRFHNLNRIPDEEKIINWMKGTPQIEKQKTV